MFMNLFHVCCILECSLCCRHSLKNYMLRIQQDALQQAMTQPQEESEYMMPIYRPKTDDGVDALYDFCYMPSSSVDPSRKTLRQNNLAPPPAKTLPVRNNDVKLNNSNTVRFKTTGPKLLETDPNVWSPLCWNFLSKVLIYVSWYCLGHFSWVHVFRSHFPIIRLSNHHREWWFGAFLMVIQPCAFISFFVLALLWTQTSKWQSSCCNLFWDLSRWHTVSTGRLIVFF